MKYNGVIQRKFALLDKHLFELQKRLKDVSLSTFRNDWALRAMTERALQVMVEIVIDVAERIIALNNAGPVATSAEAFERLVALGVLRSSQPYADMVKFRNILVHQYEEIDPELIYTIATSRLENFRQFRNEIDIL
jgi:uncharacterized protein YutE (UPF0331/DUF86 family)